MEEVKIGWIGLGKMGIPMSQRLINAGHKLTVYNRTPGRDKLLTSMGAVSADTPAELMDDCDVIIMMVSDDQATRDVFFTDNGILSSTARGRIIINMSTISPGVSTEISVICEEKGSHYLDAPVSGSLKQAINGELVVMAGGKEDIFVRVKPILDTMSKLSIYMGETGKGNKTKLAVNALLGIMSQGLSECFVFADKMGIDTSVFLEILHNSPMGNIYMDIKGQALLDKNFSPAFSIRHIAKDMRLAKESGLNMPLSNTALATYEKALTDFPDEDIIAIYKEVKRQAH